MSLRGSGRRDASKRALENAQKLAPNSADTLFALGYYQYQVLARFQGRRRPRLFASAKCYQAKARCYWLSAESRAAEENWDANHRLCRASPRLEPA